MLGAIPPDAEPIPVVDKLAQRIHKALRITGRLESCASSHWMERPPSQRSHWNRSLMIWRKNWNFS